jgi:hypothetical protein
MTGRPSMVGVKNIDLEDAAGDRHRQACHEGSTSMPIFSMAGLHLRL